MGILDFTPAANAGGIVASNRRSQIDRPPAKLWLNVGYEANGRFVNLPYGIPVDTMEELKISGQNEEWAAFQAARNRLLRAIQQAGDGLEPGAEITVNLKVKLRKVNEQVSIDNEDNAFATDLSALFVTD